MSICTKGRRKGRRKMLPKRRGASRSDTRPSLKTVALTFPEYSLERVYLHGLWQMSRGRRPALKLHNQHNPRIAFETARSLVGEKIDRARKTPYWRVSWPYGNPFTEA